MNEILGYPIRQGTITSWGFTDGKKNMELLREEEDLNTCHHHMICYKEKIACFMNAS